MIQTLPDSGSREPISMSNVAKDHAHVDVQVGVVHGDARIYHVSKEDSPQRKFDVGVNYLRAGVARQAEELICNAVMKGYQSQEVAYHWMLAILSGRSFENLSGEDIARFRRANDIARETARDSWGDAVDVVTDLVECLAAQEITQDPNVEKVDAVMLAYGELPEDRRAEIARHLDMMLRGTVQDRVEKLDVEHARRHRHDNHRRKRVHLYFEPEPLPPRPIFRREMPVDPTPWLRLAAGLALGLAGIPFAVSLLSGISMASTILIGSLWTVGCGLLVSSAPRWHWTRQRARETEPDYQPAEPQWLAQSSKDGRKFVNRATKAVDKAFNTCAPMEDPQRTAWAEATRVMRAELIAELADNYHDVAVNRIYWLIERKAKAARKLWRETGRARPVLAGPGWVLSVRYALSIAVMCAGLYATTDRLFHTNPWAAALVCLPLGPGVVLVFLGVTPLLRNRIQHKADSSERMQRLGEELMLYRRWRDYLFAHRPGDVEMGQWLDCDLRHLKAQAVQRYGLSSREVIAHLALTEPAPDCRRARYVFGPPRYSKYIVTVFLLTSDGVRQWQTTLRFASGTEINERRQSFRYDAIALARVADFGTTVHGNRRYVETHRSETDSLVSRSELSRALRITLVGGSDDAINILIENFEEEFADTRESDEYQLFEIAVDSSGITTALRMLEAIAADGKEWIKRDHQRRERHALIYVDKDPAEVGALN